MNLLTRFAPLSLIPENWIWEAHLKNGLIQKQYIGVIETPITDVLSPIEGLDHHFSFDGLDAFILRHRQGGLVGLDFSRSQFVHNKGAAPFSYQPECFFYFRRVTKKIQAIHKGILTTSLGLKNVDMEFHFGIAKEGFENQEMIVT